MIVKFDALNRMEQPALFLCSPSSTYDDGKLTGIIGGLAYTEAEENIFNFNAPSELNFRINLPNNDFDETGYDQSVTDVYDAIANRRLIFMPNIGYFVITHVDETKEENVQYKDVQAKSVEKELEQKEIPYIEDGTYPFLTDEGNNEGLFNKIMAVIPSWTAGHIDDTVAEKYRTFEDVSVEMNCYAFMIEEMQSAYECIFEFDAINRQVSVYDQSNYVHTTSIRISNDDVVDSLKLSEDSEDLYTAISVAGGGDLGISAVNPIGANTIYNFSHYLSWMSPELRNKIGQWMDDVDAAEENYLSLSESYYDELQNNSTMRLDIESINTQIEIYKRCRDNIVASQTYDPEEHVGEEVSEHTVDMIDQYNEVLEELGGEVIAVSIEDQITELLDIIDGIIADTETRKAEMVSDLETSDATLATIYSSIEAVINSLSLTSILSPSEYEELSKYIYEGSYTDEYVIVTDIMTYPEKLDQMKILYDRAKKQLERISKPKQDFTVDVESFIFEKDFREWTGQLETGCLVDVEVKAGEIAQLFLSSITVNYDDKTMSLKFGSRYDKYDTESLFQDVLGSVSQSANSINYIMDQIYPIKVGEIDRLREAIINARNLSMQDALSATNQAFVIDGAGITGRKINENNPSGFDDKQVKMTSNLIVFTDDGWQTCKVAIGDMGNGHYGINAETIVGNLIIGENLILSGRLESANGNFVLDMTTGELYLSSSLWSSDIDSAIDSYSYTVDTAIQDLQNQIDGTIETYNGTEEPTLNNYPAQGWTADQYAAHVGDLFVGDEGSDIEGFWFRFQYNRQTDTYSWVHLRDNEIQQAIQDAADALDAAYGSVHGSDVEYYKSTSATALNPAPTIPGDWTGNWQTDSPQWEAGYYIWTRTKFMTALYDPSSPELGTYWYSTPVCITGSPGASGTPGTSVDISTTEIKYATSSDGEHHPTSESDWSVTIPTVAKGQYLWTRTIVRYSNGQSTTSYSVSYAGTDGHEGSDSYTYIRYSKYSNGVNPNTGRADFTDTPSADKEYIGICVTSSSTAPTTANSYQWSKYLGDDGDPGNGIDNIYYKYTLTQTQTAPDPSNESLWSSSIPSMSSTNKYLWQREIIDYTDASMADKVTVILLAVYGDPGRSITNVTEYYIKWQYSDAAHAPTRESSGWQQSPPQLDTTYKYMWNYEEITYSYGSPDHTTPKVVAIYTQDGRSITSVVNWYLASNITTASQLPTKGQAPWTTAVQTPSASAKYLWNYEVVNYSTGQPDITDPCIIGNFAADGGDVTVYSVVPSVSAIIKSEAGAFSPTYIEFTATSTTGTGSPASCTGTFVIKTSSDGVSYAVPSSGTSITQSYARYTLSGNVKFVRCELYDDSSRTTLLDQQTVPVILDGNSSITYYLQASHAAIIKKADGTYNPTAITFYSKEQAGINPMSGYSGYFKIETQSTEGGTWSNKTIQGNPQETYSYTIPSGIIAVRCSLYADSSMTTLLDQQIIPIVSDGTDGKDAYTVILTNENHTFAANETSAISGSADCNVIAYKGSTQVVAHIGTITGLPSAGMSVNIYNNDTVSAYFRVSVTTDLTTKNGVLTIPVTIDNGTSSAKTFNMKFTYSLALKGTPGSSATAYSLLLSHAAIVKDRNGGYNPESIVLSAKSRSGDSPVQDYAGYFKIETQSSVGGTWSNKTISGNPQSSYTYEIPSGIIAVRCSLYSSSTMSASTLLDQQIVPVVSDGSDGGDAYTVILTNENHTFVGNETSALSGNADCNVIAYKGATQVAANIGTITGLPSEGMSVNIYSNNTTSAYFRVSVTTSMTTKNGVLTVPVTIDNGTSSARTFNMKFTYSLALKGAPGDAATSYTLVLSHAAIVKGANGSFNPSSITMSAKSQTGNQAMTDYAARFKVEPMIDGAWGTATTTTARTSYSYSIPSNATAIRCSLHRGDVTIDDSTMLDQQIVPVVNDGENFNWNLLENTKDFSGWVKSDNVSFSSDTPTHNIYVNDGTINWYIAEKKSQLSPYSEIRNQQITISFYVKGNSSSSNDTTFCYEIDLCTSVNDMTRVKYTDPQPFTFKLTTSWQKVSVTTTISDSMFANGTGTVTTSRGYRFVFGTLADGVCTNQTAYRVRELKVEFGNKATAWKPAINDALGIDAYTVILTNENHTFVGSETAALAGSAECGVIAYKGATQVSAYIDTITGLPAAGMSVRYNNNGSTSASFTVTVTTAMDTKNGVLDVPVVIDRGTAAEKTFNMKFTYSLALKGANAVTYYVSPSANAIIRDTNSSGTLTPANVTFSALKKEGNGNPSTYSDAKFIVDQSIDGSSWTNSLTYDGTSSGVSSAIYPSGSSSSGSTTIGSTAKYIRCRLYAHGGSTVLDTETVTIINTGLNGSQGPTGADAYTVILTNENHTFAGSATGALAGSTECQVIAYKGATQVAATIGTISGKPSGMTTSISQNGTTSAYFSVSIATSMTTMSGVLTIPITVDGKSFSKRFTYSVALAGTDAYTVILTNESHTFAADETKALTGQSAECEVLVYKGASQIACTLPTSVTLPSNGLTYSRSYNGTASTPGKFVIGIHATNPMDIKSGVVDIPITADGKTFTKQFTFSLAMKGDTGDGLNWNQIRNTEFFDGWKVLGTAGVFDHVNGTYTYPVLSSSEWTGISPPKNVPFAKIRDKRVTFSCEIRGAAGATLRPYPEFFLTNTEEGIYVRYKDYNFGNVTGTGDWQKITYTFDCTQAYFSSYARSGVDIVDVESCWFGVTLYRYSSNYSVSFMIRRPKLEIGDKATEWAPAEEDTYGVGNSWNLFKATRLLGRWSKEASICSIVDDTPTKSMYINDGSANYFFGEGSKILRPYSEERNKTVTVSFKIKGKTNQTNESATLCRWQLYDNNLTETKYHDRLVRFKLTTNWQKITITETITDNLFVDGSGTPNFNDCICRFEIGTFGNQATVCTNTAPFYIKEIKAELGSVATEWAPSADDSNEYKNTELYYLTSSTTPPDAPTEHVTQSADVSEQWTTTMPTWSNDHNHYFTCIETLHVDGSYSWTTPVGNAAYDSTGETGDQVEGLGPTLAQIAADAQAAADEAGGAYQAIQQLSQQVGQLSQEYVDQLIQYLTEQIQSQDSATQIAALQAAFDSWRNGVLFQSFSVEDDGVHIRFKKDNNRGEIHMDGANIRFLVNDVERSLINADGFNFDYGIITTALQIGKANDGTSTSGQWTWTKAQSGHFRLVYKG